jgi:dihydroxyacetone kinase
MHFQPCGCFERSAYCCDELCKTIFRVRWLVSRTTITDQPLKTGDVLNFGLAAEKAKAAGLGVDMIVVGDDCGVPRSRSGKVGRRGIAGTCLVQKISGAMAADGASLEEVRSVTQLTCDNLVSIGSSLSHVHVPGREASTGEDELGAEEVEIGMGIHNESGAEKAKVELPKLVETMLRYMLNTNDKERSFLKVEKSDDTVLLVNNLGGVSPLEMSGIAHEVLKQLSSTRGIKPVRILVGTFMTSLNGMGFSISLLKLQDTKYKKSMLELLDASTEAPGWSNNINAKSWSQKAPSNETATADAGREATSDLKRKYRRQRHEHPS